KGLSFWLLVIMIPVAVIQFSGNRSEAAAELDYTSYRDELEADNIARATIQDGSVVTGEFRQRKLMGGKEIKRFTVRLPMKDDQAEVSALREKKVRINAQPARPSIGTFFFNYLPIMLLIGFWIFIFRQMQAGGAKAFSFGKS